MSNIPEAACWQDLEFDQTADRCRVSSGVDTVGIRVFVGPGGEESKDPSSDVAVEAGGEESKDPSSDVAVGSGIEVDGDANSDGAKMPVSTIRVTAIAIRSIRR
jgi:hypothetical protein